MNLTDKFMQFTLLGAEWVLWLLVALSIISVYVMIERWMFLRSVERADRLLRRKVLNALTNGDLPQVRELTKGSSGTGVRMVTEMVAAAPWGQSGVDAALDSVRAEERIRLERNVSFLGTLGANAPFIGLFGTVLGIIQAFNDLQHGIREGAKQSEVVMAGISEALVATAIGLLVAIPAVIAYNVLQRRIKRMLAEAGAFAKNAYPFIADQQKREV